MSAFGKHQGGLLLAALLLASGASAAAADDGASKEDDASSSPSPEQKRACISSHHAGQIARKHGELLAALERFGSCAQPDCPAPIRRECAQWLFDVERELPTIVVRVTDAEGVATDAARVWVDGNLVFDRVDGRALSLNPGTHRVRVQLDSGKEVTSQLLVHEGEKLRTLEVTFPAEAPSDGAIAATVAPPDPTQTRSGLPEDERREVSSGVPTSTLVLGATGAAALGAALYFGLVGLGHQRDYDACLADCQSEHAAMMSNYTAADIALAVGVVSLGVGGAIWWGQGSDAEAAPSVGFILGTAGTF